ncbi:MAG: hypothetical protein H6834_17155 [Planctomycetes bacterium]|nr:hypothetical protein [Planctomycetota bacterium]MCB9892114.1 hypothetical protein [Planctomycetota bacterium]
MPEPRKPSSRRGGRRGQGRRRSHPKKATQNPTHPRVARSFWGEAWCRHFESLREFRPQQVRGYAYLRHDAVQGVEIKPGKIRATVIGMRPFRVSIGMEPIDARDWQDLRRQCRARSVMDLLSGRLPRNVLARLTDREHGVFPRPREIEFDCTCRDAGELCEHVAALVYAVAQQFDLDPKLFFSLRGISEDDLGQDGDVSDGFESWLPSHPELLRDANLEEIFGIMLSDPGKPRTAAAQDDQPNSSRRPAGRQGTSRPPRGERSGTSSGDPARRRSGRNPRRKRPRGRRGGSGRSRNDR